MQRVKSYNLGNLLGRGATADVFCAEKDNHKYALKKFHPNLVHDDSLLRRFQQEFKLSQQLKHPNIVAVHELVGAVLGSAGVIGHTMTNDRDYTVKLKFVCK